MKTICVTFVVWNLLIFSPALGGNAAFDFALRAGGLYRAPISDANGNLLSGTNYLAALYMGYPTNSLFATPPAKAFQTGTNAGFVDPSVVANTNFPCGVVLSVEVRAWDRHLGESYEVASNFKIGGFGTSKTLLLRSGGCFQDGPVELNGLESFSLEPLNGVAITSTAMDGGQFKLSWYGSFQSYRVQRRVDGGAWMDIGSSSTNLSLRSSLLSNSTVFYRVIGGP